MLVVVGWREVVLILFSFGGLGFFVSGIVIGVCCVDRKMRSCN